MTRRLLLAIFLALISLATVPAVAGADLPCAVGGSISAYINKGPVHVGQKVTVSAEVSSNAQHGHFPATCRLTHVQAAVAFADGSSISVATDATVAGGGHSRYFSAHVRVLASWITDDPTYGPLFRVTSTVTADSGLSGTASYAVGATTGSPARIDRRGHLRR